MDFGRCNPHPSRGRQLIKRATITGESFGDATRTPRGDGNIHLRQKLKLVYTGMQPAPLTGTATFAFSTSTLLQVDATRTPYGDGN